MRIPTLLLLAAGLAANPLQRADSQPVSPAPAYTYADYADLALRAPIVAIGTVREAIRLKDEQAVGVRPGHARFYVEADVTTLIRGASGLSSRVAYLVDAPLTAKGKAPKLKKQRVILLAQPVAGRPGEIRLVARDAQLPWTAPAEATLRAIVKEAVQPDAPPRITGIGNAFHVPGTLPGEGETQIFLTTPDGRPVSLNVIRRPGEEPKWAVALSEIVDEAAAPPERNSLLWYRLACALPERLPDEALENANPEFNEFARRDYQLIQQALGDCARVRKS